MKSIGVLRYGKTRRYLIVDCCNEFGRYYRTLFHKSVYKTRKIQRPLHGEHITVVRNEEPPIPEAWFVYDGEEIEFEFFPELADNNRYYFWIPVKCPRLNEIRRSLGLEPEPLCPLHITYGNEIIKPSDYHLNCNY